MNSAKFTRSPRSPGITAAFCPETIVELIVITIGRMISKMVIALIVTVYFILH